MHRDKIPPEIRFKRFVSKTMYCWLWTGARSTKGYGVFDIYLAHRFAYQLENGAIPDGLSVDHLCRNRACVNPAHLEAVTTKENILRGIGITAVNAKKTQCVNGHPFINENIYWTDGKRKCRTCMKDRKRKYTLARKAKNASR